MSVSVSRGPSTSVEQRLKREEDTERRGNDCLRRVKDDYPTLRDEGFLYALESDLTVNE